MTEKPPLTDDPSVREVFAEDFAGFLMHGPNFHFTFASYRATDDKPPKLDRVVTVRLVLPLDAALEMHQTLTNIIGVLEKKGVVKTLQEATKTVQ